MNNLSSYYGLVDAKIRASDKDLPIPILQLDLKVLKYHFGLKEGMFIKDVPFFCHFLRYLPTLVPFCPIFSYIPKIGHPTLANIPTPHNFNYQSVINTKFKMSNFY